MVVLQKA